MSTFASGAAAQVLDFVYDERSVETPNVALWEYPSAPFGFFESSVDEGPVRVSQTSWFLPDRFHGKGLARSKHSYDPGSDPGAFSSAYFEFDVSQTTEVRVEAELRGPTYPWTEFNGEAEVALYRLTAPSGFMLEGCAGARCPPPVARQRSIDAVVTLTPGRYSLSASAFVLTSLIGWNAAEWEVTLTAPPAVPLASFVGPGLAMSLATLGLAALRRRR